MPPMFQHQMPFNMMIPNNVVPMNQQQVKKQSFTVPTKSHDDIYYKYIESLEDDLSKRDYLGELLFKKIEYHKLSLLHNFTIDIIGKITGMILGIEDINEIIEICRSNSNLTARITEALDLLGFQRWFISLVSYNY